MKKVSIYESDKSQNLTNLTPNIESLLDMIFSTFSHTTISLWQMQNAKRIIDEKIIWTGYQDEALEMIVKTSWSLFSSTSTDFLAIESKTNYSEGPLFCNSIRDEYYASRILNMKGVSIWIKNYAYTDHYSISKNCPVKFQIVKWKSS